MNEIINRIKRDKILSTCFTITIAVVVLNIFYIVFFYNHLPPFIPLYNQLPWGEKRLGTREELFIPILVVFVIFNINCIFSSILYPKMPVVSRILSVTTLLVSFFALFFTARTIGLIL